MARLDYYATLGVSREASDEEIKRAYRKLVFQYHPDRNPGSARAEEKIREINAAYEVLGDPEVRRSYERLRYGLFHEFRPEPPDPAVVLAEMEQRLFDEGRREVFTLVMKDVQRIREELAVIRERTVERQGYDSFQEQVVFERGAEMLGDLLGAEAEAEAKKVKLVAVALKILVSQHVVPGEDERRLDEMTGRLRDTYQRGRLAGFRDALELFYVRR